MTIEGGRNLHYKFCSLFLPSTNEVFTYIPTDLWVFSWSAAFNSFAWGRLEVLLCSMWGCTSGEALGLMAYSSWTSQLLLISSGGQPALWSSQAPPSSAVGFEHASRRKCFQDPIHLSLDVLCSINLTPHTREGVSECYSSQPCVVAAEKGPGWQSRQCYPKRIKRRK